MLICNHTLYVNWVWLYTLWLETWLTFWKLYRQFLWSAFFFVRNSQKSWCAVLERLMEDDSSQCDHRFFLRRPISWGLAGLVNRELRWWQGCGQPRLSLPFNESSLVPSPITNLPAPWWIIIWGKNLQLAECPQTASRFLCAKAGAYNKGQFVVTHLLLVHSAPLGSLFSLKANWPYEEQPCDWWRFEWSVRLSKPWGDICHRAGLQQ